MAPPFIPRPSIAGVSTTETERLFECLALAHHARHVDELAFRPSFLVVLAVVVFAKSKFSYLIENSGGKVRPLPETVKLASGDREYAYCASEEEFQELR